MADDFARATGAAGTYQIGDQTYLISKLSPRDIGDLQAYIKEVCPNPRAEALALIREGGLPEPIAMEVWKTAVEESRDWPPSMSDERGNQLITMTFEGNARLLWVLLRRYQPGVDLAKARQLAELITLDDLGALMALGAPESASDPKAENGPPPTTTTTAMRMIKAPA